MQRAVERRFERHAVLVHEREPLLAFRDHVVRLHAGHVHGERLLEARAKRKHLESAGIGEGRSVPVHELRQSAGLVEHLLAGALVQVERVGQQALRAEVPHGFRQYGLHRGLGGHRYERRGVDVAVRGVDDAGAAVARATTALAVGRVGQTGFLFEIERVAPAGFAGFRSARMFDQIFGRCRHIRCGLAGCCGFVRRRAGLWFVQACHALNCMR